VIGNEYFSLFPGPQFITGSPPAERQAGWAVITEEWAQKIAGAKGRPPAPGDKLQLSFFHNQTFSIREVTLAGIIRYVPTNDVLKSAVIMDGRILRDLVGYSQVTGPAATGSAPAAGETTQGAGADVDSLFSGKATPNRGSTSSAPVSVQELKNLMSTVKREGTAVSASPLGHDGAWHFILVKAAADANKARVISAVRAELKKDGFAAQVRDWRGTAGAVAIYVYLLQIVLYIGLFMVGGIVLILTINSLVISVFERTAEIGTMRAIGARREFVRGLFIIETGALTTLAGVAGVVLGSILVAVLARFQLHFDNQILVLLFGGPSLQPGISVANIVVSLIASVVLGAIAWIYPVRLALRIQPVRAIHAA
jgi:ABC-type antimicrobial peptide transport system permease subunit